MISLAFKMLSGEFTRRGNIEITFISSLISKFAFDDQFGHQHASGRIYENGAKLKVLTEGTVTRSYLNGRLSVVWIKHINQLP